MTPPAARRRRAGWAIGCFGAVVVAVAVVLTAGSEIVDFLIVRSQAEVRVVSPDGRAAAELGRHCIGCEPIHYQILVRRGLLGTRTCTLARLEGYKVPDYVKFSWPVADTVAIRYGTAATADRLPRPAIETGDGACTDVQVRLIHDPALDAVATDRITGWRRQSGMADPQAADPRR